MIFFQNTTPFLLVCIAGLSTVIGGFIGLSRAGTNRYNIGFVLGFSAGMMVYISLLDLLPYAINQLSQITALSYFLAGFFVLAILDYFMPHTFIHNQLEKTHTIYDKKLFSTGIMISLGLVLHNMPEGAAVFLGSTNDIRLGALLALAIAIHNIPEGIAIAVPLYHATKSRKTALGYTIVASVAEPLGALCAYLLFMPILSPSLIATLFAIVGGIMTYISFDELLPRCIKSDSPHRAMIGIGAGMFIAFFSLNSVQLL